MEFVARVLKLVDGSHAASRLESSSTDASVQFYGRFS